MISSFLAVFVCLLVTAAMGGMGTNETLVGSDATVNRIFKLYVLKTLARF